MTHAQAVALSLAPFVPRAGLTARLLASDLRLLDLANTHLDAVGDALRQAQAIGSTVVPWNEPSFPQLLLNTADCPPALWCRGTLAVTERTCVAVVGSRAATAVALEIAVRLAADLARAGIVVVSGLARGVDSAAHRGALSTGTTIAVLGSGLDVVYPPEHRTLADEVAQRGLLVSEHPPGTPPLPFHFPLRNRLISGLCRAVVVIEAAEQSGSLITAACALEHGRDVMVVPGNALSGRNRGGHALIRDGARIVECAEDVLNELGLLPAGTGPRSGGAGGAPVDPLLAVMEEGEVYDLDQLTSALGVPAPRLLARLLELEIQGVVTRAGAGRFVRLRRTC